MNSLCFNAFCVCGYETQAICWWSRKELCVKVKWGKKEWHHQRLVLGSEVEAHHKTGTTLCQRLSIISLPPSHLLSLLVRSFEGGREGTSSAKGTETLLGTWGGGVRSSRLLAFKMFQEDGFYLFSRGRRGVFDERWPCSLTCCGPSGSWRNPWRRAGGLQGEPKRVQLWIDRGNDDKWWQNTHRATGRSTRASTAR